ncbi:MAG: RNA polymerase sigma factor [Planctomycetes bacterium]|nr:RNA polymerase sigma factor [Planctomycetota bacterium]
MRGPSDIHPAQPTEVVARSAPGRGFIDPQPESPPRLERDEILRRVRQLERETSDGSLAEIARVLAGERTVEEATATLCPRASVPRSTQKATRSQPTTEVERDLVNTVLMDVFKNHGHPGAFSLLYDLNRRLFFYTIYSRIRRYNSTLDGWDVLQEVFLNIYRYPHRFNSEKPAAFRHWANTIIRNTILKSLKSLSRTQRTEFCGEEIVECPDTRSRSPLGSVIEEESETLTGRSYYICLQLYLEMYGRLSPKEQKALYLVEVADYSYRDASAVLDIKLENLKMVIFRARKKIYRAMKKALSHAS